MKKFFIFLLCLILLALAFSLVWKNNNTPDARLHDIPASTATTQDEDTDKPEETDRTEETDRAEIQNNLRDARELIEAGATEDATMIIKSLKTRDLTESEKAELEELQKMLIVISD